MTHRRARWLLPTGLVVAIAYLLWRAADTLVGVPAWLGVSALVVEAAGIAGSAALGWALWRPDTPPAPVEGEIQWVVRFDAQRPADLRTTLDAVGAGAVVLDLSSSVAEHPHGDRRSSGHELAEVVAAAGGRLIRVDPTRDAAGVAAMARSVTAPGVIVLDAGDVPLDGWRAVLGPATDDVAIVQGRLVDATYGACGAEHEPDGRYELDFEYAALGPALGARGVAMWIGSGAWLRTAVLADLAAGPLGVSSSAVESQVAFSALLHRRGWRITATATPVVERVAQRSATVVHAERTSRVHAACRTVFGGGGALRSRRSLDQRLALLAWSVRPFAGARRAAFVAVIVASLVAGHAPAHVAGATSVFGALWLPAVALTALGVVGSSRGTLRLGDRVRASVRSIGPVFAALRSRSPAHRPQHAPIIDVPPVHQGLVAVVAALGTVSMMRGISDRVTHTLGHIADGPRWVLLGTALWLLSVAVQLLRQPRPGLVGHRSANRGSVVLASIALVGVIASSVPDDTAGTERIAERPAVTLVERAP